MVEASLALTNDRFWPFSYKIACQTYLAEYRATNRSGWGLPLGHRVMSIFHRVARSGLFIYVLSVRKRDGSHAAKHNQAIIDGLEDLAERYFDSVDLFVPIENRDDRIANEIYQSLRPLLRRYYSALPALLISKRPIENLSLSDDDFLVIPFGKYPYGRVHELIERIEGIIVEYDPPLQAVPTEDTSPETIWSSVELKPGLFGFRIDLKKLYKTMSR